MILTDEIKPPKECGAVKVGSIPESAGLFYKCECLFLHPQTTLSPCQMIGEHAGPHKSVATTFDEVNQKVERWWVDWWN